MTQIPHDNPSGACIIWVNCDGKRTQSGYNKKEADELLIRLRAIIGEEYM